MAYNHEKTVEYEADGLHQQVTYVKPTATKIDEKGLRKALTAKVYDKYTVKKLDRGAMEAAIDRGELDPRLVLRFVSADERQPYQKYSEKKVTDEQEG
jgi:hypothetical protein